MVYLTTLSAAPIRSVEWYDDWRKMKGNGLVKNLPEIFLQGLLDALTEFQTADLQNTRDVRCSGLLRSEQW